MASGHRDRDMHMHRERCRHDMELHNASATYFDRLGRRWRMALFAVSLTNLVALFLSHILGHWFKYVIGCLAMLFLVIWAIMTQQEHQRLATLHRLAAKKYFELSESICVNMLLPVEHRRDISSHVNSTFASLKMLSPLVPDVVKCDVSYSYKMAQCEKDDASLLV
jgi:hypothetical protein